MFVGLGKQLVTREVEYKVEGVAPLGKVFDLADQTFPLEFRNRDIYPLSKVRLPSITEQKNVLPDVIVPPK